MAVLVAPSCDEMDGEGRGRSRITVVDGETGEPLWTRELPSEGISIDSFAPADEIAVYGYDRCTTDDVLRAYDARTGEEHEPPPFEGYPLPEALRGSEACDRLEATGDALGIADGACLFQQTAQLVALEVETGEERYSVPLQPNDLVVRLDGPLFKLTTNSVGIESGIAMVALLSLETGAVVWSVQVRDQSPRAIGAHVVYLSGAGPEVIALALEDGEELWRAELDCADLIGAHDLLVCVQQIRPGTCTYEAD